MFLLRSPVRSYVSAEYIGDVFTARVVTMLFCQRCGSLNKMRLRNTKLDSIGRVTE